MTNSEDSFGLSRREFVTVGLTAGFALAVGPISAFALSTPTDGLEVGEIPIPVTHNQAMPGYWAMPKGKGPFPVLLVCHEIFGVHEHIRDVCRRFAQQGFLAVAPYLYFRQGDVTKMKDIPQIIGEVVSKVTPPQVMSDLDATVAFIKKSGKGNLSHLGVTGFCWGGRMTWLYAAHNSRVKAGVAWYGPLVGDPGSGQMPVDIAAKLTVPVLGLYGGKDGHILPDHVKNGRGAEKRGRAAPRLSSILTLPTVFSPITEILTVRKTPKRH